MFHIHHSPSQYFSCKCFISDNYCFTFTILNRLNISVASAKRCDCLARNSSPGTFLCQQIYKYKKYKYTKNIRTHQVPFHPNNFLYCLAPNGEKAKKAMPLFFERIFYWEAIVWNIKWWKDLISNIGEFIFIKTRVFVLNSIIFHSI